MFADVHDIARAAKKIWKPTRHPAARPTRTTVKLSATGMTFPTLEEVDFNGKLVALFGCGDQEDYAEYFCDALGTIRDIIEPRGAHHHWPLADCGLSF